MNGRDDIRRGRNGTDGRDSVRGGSSGGDRRGNEKVRNGSTEISSSSDTNLSTGENSSNVSSTNTGSVTDGGVQVTQSKTKWLVLFAVTLLIAFALSSWASPHPDGLVRVAEDHGFIDREVVAEAWSPLAGYEVSKVSSNLLKVGLAGVAGVLAIVAVLYGIFTITDGVRSRKQAPPTPPSL